MASMTSMPMNLKVCLMTQDSKQDFRVVRVETRTTYPEGRALGSVIETQAFDHPVFGPFVCRTRIRDGIRKYTLELDHIALEKLGFKFSFYRNRGSRKMSLEKTGGEDGTV